MVPFSFDLVLEGVGHGLEDLLESAVQVVQLVGHTVEVFIRLRKPPAARLDAVEDAAHLAVALLEFGLQDGESDLIHIP